MNKPRTYRKAQDVDDDEMLCETRESHDANHPTLDRGRHQRSERTPGGDDWVRVPVEPDTILDARASSARQFSCRDTEERLPRARYPDGRVVRDTGSGVDFRRRGRVALLERALRGDAVHVVAATPDRITRSGYPLARHVIELSGGRTELLEEDDLTGQFHVLCLVACITSFCNARHGKRSGQGHEEDQGLPEGP
ncbi:MAG: hypothetical protein OXF88_10100 [Rhodobacteraceae bacterium]|nr:hypothetical protein [Paracoccaceae bacterium]